MWRFKQFAHKEQSGLEGRTLDVGNLKIHVTKAIAEGGFSCVYLARDLMHPSKQYGLKHMICNDAESLEIIMKEIQVMKSLKGHSNVVTLYAHTIMDMGRTKEALIVMDFCEKSLVNVLESRGAGYFEETRVLTIFRDVCNAVFAMHCQTPPIAHRDLKAENLLLGSDGLWKLCDFGSTSINHKRFERPEEMGIEEDNIRKHTTPAYRAPEMWDLYRRELINEKVDIWALGCLLFRICYFKSAFDGESKLQVLNGNYRIPDQPKYSSSIIDLIGDMLQASPEDRPDITQVWFRVNDLFPVEQQKSLPEQPPAMHQSTFEMAEGHPKSSNTSPAMPRRSPPPPSTREQRKSSSPPPPHVSNPGGCGGQLGAFWSTQYAKNTILDDKVAPKFDDEPVNPAAKHNQSHSQLPGSGTAPSKDFDMLKPSKSESTTSYQNDTFNAFVADFDTSKLSSAITNKGKEQDAEVEKLKEQLKQANLEKSEITSKFEKLSAICRSQRQEIQELKQALATRSPSPNKDTINNQTSPVIQHLPTHKMENIEGVWELQQGSVEKRSPSSDPKQWQPFLEPPKLKQPLSKETTSRSVRTRNGMDKKPESSGIFGNEKWDFGSESFTAVPTKPHNSRGIGEGKSISLRFNEPKSSIDGKPASQPGGWAGF